MSNSSAVNPVIGLPAFGDDDAEMHEIDRRPNVVATKRRLQQA